MRGYYETDPEHAHDNSKAYPTSYGGLSPTAAGNFPPYYRSDVVGVSKQDAENKTEPIVGGTLVANE